MDTTYPPSTLLRPLSPNATGEEDEDEEQYSPVARNLYNRSHSLTSASSLLDGEFSGTLDDNMSFPSAHVLAEENRKLKKENEELRNSMAEKNAGLLGMQRRYNHLESKLETMKRATKPSSSEMNNATETTTLAEVEALRAEAETLKAEIEEMTLKEAHLQSAFQDAKQKSETLAEEKATLTEANMKLSEENQKMTEEANTLTQSNQQLEEENRDLKHQRRDANNESIQLKSQLAEIKASLKQAKEESQQLSDANAGYQSEIDRLKSAIEVQALHNEDQNLSNEALKVIDEQQKRIKVLETILSEEGYDLNA